MESTQPFAPANRNKNIPPIARNTANASHLWREVTRVKIRLDDRWQVFMILVQ